MAMKQLDSVMVDYIAGHFGADMTVSRDDRQTVLVVAPHRIYELLERLKNEEPYKMDFLSNLTAVEYPDYMEIVYHLYSLELEHSVTVKSRLAHDNPQAASVTPLWPAADLQEREVFDMLGVNVSGHPNLSRILLPEGFDGHPLRKDYKLMARSAEMR